MRTLQMLIRLALGCGLAALLLIAVPTPGSAQTAKATFAGGCFWCMEPPFDELDGVISTTSGYIGGKTKNPTYEQVSSGTTGHAEALQVVYDPKKITYEKLLEVYWRNIDPFAADGQFCDLRQPVPLGDFYHDANQKSAAEKSKKAIQARFKQPVLTEITAAAVFYPAEDYHQDYYKKNPVRYKLYSHGCGRAQRLEEVWGAAKK